MIKHIHSAYLFCALLFILFTSNNGLACTGRDVIFTNITVTSIASGSYQYSYEVKNIGTTDISMNKIAIQNYVSTDNQVGGGSYAAAGGSYIAYYSSDILAPGATYSGTMGVYPFSANPQNTYPYIVAYVNLATDPECDVANNYYVALIEVTAVTQSSHIANATVNWMSDSKSFLVSNWSGNSTALHYSVYTSSGILMLTACTKENETTPLNGLPNGFYILYLSDGEKIYSKKILY